MMLRFTSVVPPAIVSERVCMSRSPQLALQRREAQDAGGDHRQLLSDLAPDHLDEARLGAGRKTLQGAGSLRDRTAVAGSRPPTRARRALWRTTGSPARPALPTSSISSRMRRRVEMCRFATPLRSNVSVAIATVQPWCSGPRSASAGIRTSSKKISQNSASPVAVRSGRTSMPGSSMSTMKHEMPLCFDAVGSVRASSSHQRASCPSVPHLLAVEDPAVAVALGRVVSERGRCRRRLAEALTPDLIAAEHWPQQSFLLRIGAIRHDRRSDVGQADGIERAGRAAASTSSAKTI